MNARFLLVPCIVLAHAALLLWWYLQPDSLGIMLGAATILYVFGAQWLDRTRRDWWHFALLPIVWTVSVVLFASLVSGAFSLPVLLFIALLGNAVYWRYADLYAMQSSRYRPFSLERLSLLINFLSIFFFAAAAYGVKTFLDVPTWLMGLCFSAFVCLVVYQWAWISKMDWKVTWRLPTVAAIIVIELFFLILSFPLDFRILGFLVAIIYYAVISLIDQHTKHGLPPKTFKLALILIIIAWLAVILTARWL